MVTPARLAPPDSCPSDVAQVWREVVAAYGAGAERIVGSALEAYCGQVARLREAQRRLRAEGMVIADPKGAPIPHPALAVERQAQAEIRAWGSRFEKPRTGRVG